MASGATWLRKETQALLFSSSSRQGRPHPTKNGAVAKGKMRKEAGGREECRGKAL